MHVVTLFVTVDGILISRGVGEGEGGGGGGEGFKIFKIEDCFVYSESIC